MNFICSESIPELVDGHLFNDQTFHDLKSEKGCYYSLQDSNITMARISFYIDDEVAISGFQAPFGSIDYRKGIRTADLHSFMSQCIENLRTRKVKKIIIKQAPGCINTLSKSDSVLLDMGFNENVVEINQHLDVTQAPFSQIISQKERNKVNRGELEDYEFKILAQSDIPEAYKLIADSYNRKDYPLTLGEEGLAAAYRHLPERYEIFGLLDESMLIAVIASVRVSQDVLYNFYHADLESYRTRSPLVMLIGQVYNYCSEKEIAVLDLGISSVDGQVNDGLFRFKKNIGCRTTAKKTLVLEL